MFNVKQIRVLIQKDDGSVNGQTEFYEYTNCPIEVKIDRAMPNTANIKIYGVQKEDMALMTVLQRPQDGIKREKSVRIFATSGNAEVLFFEGHLMYCMPVYNSSPDIYMEIQANAGGLFNYVDIPPSIFKGSTPAPKLIEAIAKSLDMNVVNYGVETIAVNPHFESVGLYPRLNEISKAYNFRYNVKDNTTIEIYPKEYEGQIEWNITPDLYTGYPSLSSTGVSLTFDEALDIKLHHFLNIAGSEISSANGVWKVIKISYSLSTKIGGHWNMRVECRRAINGV